MKNKCVFHKWYLRIVNLRVHNKINKKIKIEMIYLGYNKKMILYLIK